MKFMQTFLLLLLLTTFVESLREVSFVEHLKNKRRRRRLLEEDPAPEEVWHPKHVAALSVLYGIYFACFIWLYLKRRQNKKLGEYTSLLSEEDAGQHQPETRTSKAMTYFSMIYICYLTIATAHGYYHDFEVFVEHTRRPAAHISLPKYSGEVQVGVEDLVEYFGEEKRNAFEAKVASQGVDSTTEYPKKVGVIQYLEYDECTTGMPSTNPAIPENEVWKFECDENNNVLGEKYDGALCTGVGSGFTIINGQHHPTNENTGTRWGKVTYECETRTNPDGTGEQVVKVTQDRLYPANAPNHDLVLWECSCYGSGGQNGDTVTFDSYRGCILMSLVSREHQTFLQNQIFRDGGDAYCTQWLSVDFIEGERRSLEGVTKIAYKRGEDLTLFRFDETAHWENLIQEHHRKRTEAFENHPDHLEMVKAVEEHVGMSYNYETGKFEAGEDMTKEKFEELVGTSIETITEDGTDYSVDTSDDVGSCKADDYKSTGRQGANVNGLQFISQKIKETVEIEICDLKETFTNDCTRVERWMPWPLNKIVSWACTKTIEVTMECDEHEGGEILDENYKNMSIAEISPVFDSDAKACGAHPTLNHGADFGSTIQIVATDQICEHVRWFPERGRNEMACFNMIMDNPWECSTEFINFRSGTGVTNCGCVERGSHCHRKEFRQPHSGQPQVKVLQRMGATRLVASGSLCGHGGQWLNKGNLSYNACFAATKLLGCSQEFFQYRDGYSSASHDCGCVPAGTNCLDDASLTRNIYSINVYRNPHAREPYIKGAKSRGVCGRSDYSIIVDQTTCESIGTMFGGGWGGTGTWAHIDFYGCFVDNTNDVYFSTGVPAGAETHGNRWPICSPNIFIGNSNNCGTGTVNPTRMTSASILDKATCQSAAAHLSYTYGGTICQPNSNFRGCYLDGTTIRYNTCADPNASASDNRLPICIRKNIVADFTKSLKDHACTGYDTVITTLTIDIDLHTCLEYCSSHENCVGFNYLHTDTTKSCDMLSGHVSGVVVVRNTYCFVRDKGYGYLDMCLCMNGYAVSRDRCPGQGMHVCSSCYHGYELTDGICVPSLSDCEFNDGRWYTPLNGMSGEGRTIATVAGCRARCASTAGCSYYNSFPNGGCHIAGSDAVIEDHSNNNPTSSSGCGSCEYTDGRWYEPMDHPSRSVETLAGCRARCARTEGCRYYNWFHDGGCHVSGPDAVVVDHSANNPTESAGCATGAEAAISDCQAEIQQAESGTLTGGLTSTTTSGVTYIKHTKSTSNKASYSFENRKAGCASLLIRYSSTSGASLKLYVNGAQHSVVSFLWMGAAGDWLDREVKYINVKAGTNVIELRVDGDFDGPNIDKVTLTDHCGTETCGHTFVVEERSADGLGCDTNGYLTRDQCELYALKKNGEVSSIAWEGIETSSTRPKRCYLYQDTQVRFNNHGTGQTTSNANAENYCLFNGCGRRVIQAESDGVLVSMTVVNSEYIDPVNSHSSATYTIEQRSPGCASMSIRYALLSSTAGSLKLFVNHALHSVVWFASTGGSETWVDRTLTYVQMVEGINIIELRADGNNVGPNIDRLVINNYCSTAAVCEPHPCSTQSAQSLGDTSGCCTYDNPCPLRVGDCNIDDECQGDLRCNKQNIGNDYGYGNHDVDVCGESDPEWIITGTWTDCSAKCNTGVQTRIVTCNKGQDSLCASVAQPATSKSCNTQNCPPPAWVHGLWSPCSTTCGMGTRTRPVACNKGLDTLCESSSAAGTKPLSSEDCNRGDCMECRDIDEWCSSQKYNGNCPLDWAKMYCQRTCDHCPVDVWVEGDWGICNCHGKQTRDVGCSTGRNSYCNYSDGLKPATERSCTASANCPTWNTGHWGACSVTCDHGVKIRSVTCSTGTDTDCNADARPAHSVSCYGGQHCPSCLDQDDSGTYCSLRKMNNQCGSSDEHNCQLSCGWCHKGTGIYTKNPQGQKFYLQVCGNNHASSKTSRNGWCEKFYYKTGNGYMNLYTQNEGVKYYLKLCGDGPTSKLTASGWCEQFYFEDRLDGTYGIYTKNGNTRYYLKIVNNMSVSFNSRHYGWGEGFYLEAPPYYLRAYQPLLPTCQWTLEHANQYCTNQITLASGDDKTFEECEDLVRTSIQCKFNTMQRDSGSNVCKCIPPGANCQLSAGTSNVYMCKEEETADVESAVGKQEATVDDVESAVGKQDEEEVSSDHYNRLVAEQTYNDAKVSKLDDITETMDTVVSVVPNKNFFYTPTEGFKGRLDNFLVDEYLNCAPCPEFSFGVELGISFSFLTLTFGAGIGVGRTDDGVRFAHVVVVSGRELEAIAFGGYVFFTVINKRINSHIGDGTTFCVGASMFFLEMGIEICVGWGGSPGGGWSVTAPGTPSTKESAYNSVGFGFNIGLGFSPAVIEYSHGRTGLISAECREENEDRSPINLGHHQEEV